MLRLAAIAAGLVLLSAPIPGAAQSRVVVVQPGDALSRIAVRAGVRVEDLKRWNELEGDSIRPGQKLRLHADSRRARPTDAARTPQEASKDEIDWTPPFDYGAAKVEAKKPGSAPVAASRTSVAVAAAGRADDSLKPGRTYLVKSGDTLSSIASRFGIGIAEIQRSNPGLRADRIYVGQSIDIGSPRPRVQFRLERGDTLAALAARHQVSTRDVMEWNPKLRASRLSPGTELGLYTRLPVSASQAVGPTNAGRLLHAVQLRSHPGYVIRSPQVAYGTEETTRWVVDAFNAVDRRFQRRKVVRVHDISDRDGGPLSGHKSHQNGRDVDISYYQDDCPRSGCAFRTFRSSELDVARQWTLLEHWLEHGQAEMIFIDYRLQAKLYRHARRKGVSEADLSRWIQYPRGKFQPSGVIRHFPKHDDHLHVRFVCPYSDLKCRR